ncbi:hypothetical protein [Deinococcus sp. QL22]|uniref:hypothetical protein n=1 Tax=Deinococcus sp. QL22 TaxID=2939437 RepID=UPI002017E0EB|nr:hypothetical protein [Deinococcus sp. QL22]UQN08678.1 hypothetical protein M1R55_21380 [Deinococcus sp. QL22]
MLWSLCAVLVGCTAPTPAPLPEPVPGPTRPAGPRSLGLVEITFVGVGTAQPQSVAVRALPPGLEGQALTDRTAGLQMKPAVNGSFDVPTPVGLGRGTRHLWATFNIRNAQLDGTPYSTAQQNITLLAVAGGAASGHPTYSGTAVRDMKRFDGSPLADPAALAQSVMPLHGRSLQGSKVVINASQMDFQILPETEVADLQTTLTHPDLNLLPYGFVVQCVTNCVAGSRTLSANPAPDQYDGQVTVALRFPKPVENREEPYTFSMLFEVVLDSETRVTQSLDEQQDNAAVTTRALALGASQVVTFGDSTYGSGATTITYQCGWRVAGPVDAPSVFLGYETTSNRCKSLYDVSLLDEFHWQ